MLCEVCWGNKELQDGGGGGMQVISSALSPQILKFHVALAHVTDVRWLLWPKTNHSMRYHKSGTAVN